MKMKEKKFNNKDETIEKEKNNNNNHNNINKNLFK